jgi:hypothetical protein
LVHVRETEGRDRPKADHAPLENCLSDHARFQISQRATERLLINALGSMRFNPFINTGQKLMLEVSFVFDFLNGFIYFISRA